MPGIIENLGLPREQVDRDAWAVDREGRCYRGAAAINRVWSDLPHWHWLAGLYAFPALAWIGDRVYRWIAAHRALIAHFISSVPACKRPGSACR